MKRISSRREQRCFSRGNAVVSGGFVQLQQEKEEEGLRPRLGGGCSFEATAELACVWYSTSGMFP